MSDEIKVDEYIVCKVFSDSKKRLLSTGDSVPADLSAPTLKNYAKAGMIVKKSEFDKTPEAKSLQRYTELNPEKVNADIEKKVNKLVKEKLEKESELDEATTVLSDTQKLLDGVKDEIAQAPEDTSDDVKKEMQDDETRLTDEVDGYQKEVDTLTADIETLELEIKVQKEKLIVIE